jgi:hypothetical protein
MKLDSEHTVEVHSEIVVVGFNPEDADVGNPNGAIHAEIFFVVITDNFDGGRIRHNRNFFDKDEAYKLVSRIEEVGEIDFHYWANYRPVYGSKAYEANMEEEIALEKKDEGFDSSWGKDRLASDGFTVIKWNTW